MNGIKQCHGQRIVMIKLMMLLFIVFYPSAFAKSSVWKAEKNGQHIYLGGTIHLLTKADYPLPREYDLAYKKSQLVYFETDIEALKGSSLPAKMSKALQSKNNKTLDQVLNANTIEILKAYMDERQLKFEDYNHYSPSGMYLVLLSLELTRSGLTGMGVDEYFAKRARRDRKTQRKFETIDQHLLFLSKMAAGSADQMILNGIQDMQNVSAMASGLKRIWRLGNRQQFKDLILNPYKKYYPSAYDVLLVQRNNLWMPKIEALFETPEVEFVLVGAMHMIGEHGILQRLEAKGYRVEPL